MTKTITSPLTYENAVEFSNEVIRLEAVVKDMKTHLKKFVEANGVLEADGVVWKFQDAESWDFDGSDKTKDFLKSLIIDGYTVDPYSVVSVSKTKLDKLGLDDQYLSNFAKKKITKRFVNRKKIKYIE